MDQMSKSTRYIYKDPLLSNVRSRILDKDQDGLIAMVGERGSGKSGSSISLSHMLDRDYKGRSRFNLPPKYLPKGFKLLEGEVMPRVVWTPEDFLTIIMEENLPELSCIIFDEIGVAGDSREFMTRKNRMLKQTMETIRSRNLVIFMTAPTLSSFDASLRRSMSHYINFHGIVPKQVGLGSCARSRVYISEVNARDGRIYLKYFKFRDEYGFIRKMKNYFIPKPPSYLENPYKRLKEFMQNKLYDRFKQEFKDVAAGVKKKKVRRDNRSKLDSLGVSIES